VARKLEGRGGGVVGDSDMADTMDWDTTSVSVGERSSCGEGKRFGRLYLSLRVLTFLSGLNGRITRLGEEGGYNF
jgi:hypothetical protein